MVAHPPTVTPPLPHTENSRRYRTIWISDLHLGSAGCQSDALLDFLTHHDCDTLYLVGDIIDGWQLKRRWIWPQGHNDVVQMILRKARKGTQVIYVPGNHDDFARNYVDHHFGGIEVVYDAEHTTIDGKRLWITHGDLFDGVMQYARWLAYLGDRLYQSALLANAWFNRARARMGLGYWSLSQFLKHKVKDAVSFITAFENALIQEARRRGYDGVVCGHIHKAELREVDGILYCNDGDWVESRTALVEHWDGRLEIIEWSPPLAAGQAIEPARVPAQAAGMNGAPLPAAARVRATAVEPATAPERQAPIRAPAATPDRGPLASPHARAAAARMSTPPASAASLPARRMHEGVLPE